jgi:hypothetical protein
VQLKPPAAACTGGQCDRGGCSIPRRARSDLIARRQIRKWDDRIVGADDGVRVSSRLQIDRHSPDTPDVVVRSAWVYTRSTDAVRIEVRDEETRFRLVVNGPGFRSYDEVCIDYLEAIQSQLAHESQLFAQGFVLEAFERPATQPVLMRRPL